MNQNGLVFPEPFADIQTGRLTTTIAAPIRLADAKGVVGMGNLLDNYGEIFGSLPFHKESWGFLLSKSGKILYHPNPELVKGGTVFLVHDDGQYGDVVQRMIRAEQGFTQINVHGSPSHALDTIQSLSNPIEAKDPYTRGRSERIEEYALKIGQRLAYSEEDLLTLRYAAILHDIGKIGIPSHILTKSRALTEDEYMLVKSHPEIGYRILKDIDYLQPVSLVIHQHHERMDGLGYPQGLKGCEISEKARILSVVDAFDAMTSSRPYRSALSVQTACRELVRCTGTQLDPVIVEEFFAVLRDEGHLEVEIHTA